MSKPRFFLTATTQRQAGEMIGRALDGVPLTTEEALAVYGNPGNWKKIDGRDEDGDPRCYWAWDGPTICGYELAQRAVQKALAGEED